MPHRIPREKPIEKSHFLNRGRWGEGCGEKGSPRQALPGAGKEGDVSPPFVPSTLKVMLASSLFSLLDLNEAAAAADAFACD